MPFLMPTRTESLVFFEQEIQIGATLRWLEANPELRFFHLVLAALVRTLAERPQLNRFTRGGRLYQREHIELSFAVKKRLSDEASMTMMKVRFEPGDALAQIVERVEDAVRAGRAAEPTGSEREMGLVLRLPGFCLRALMRVQRWLDAWGLLPYALVRGDPLYASVVVANLGSVGIDAAYHHLYEYGNAPLFATIGRIERRPIVDEEGALAVGEVVRLRYSFDERITDGFYCARSLERLERYLRDPEQLREARPGVG